MYTEKHKFLFSYLRFESVLYEPISTNLKENTPVYAKSKRTCIPTPTSLYDLSPSKQNTKNTIQLKPIRYQTSILEKRIPTHTHVSHNFLRFVLFSNVLPKAPDIAWWISTWLFLLLLEILITNKLPPIYTIIVMCYIKTLLSKEPLRANKDTLPFLPEQHQHSQLHIFIQWLQRTHTYNITQSYSTAILLVI